MSTDVNEYNPEKLAVSHYMRTLVRFPKLLVAAVNGPVVGVGVTTLLHCDISNTYLFHEYVIGYIRCSLFM